MKARMCVLLIVSATVLAWSNLLPAQSETAMDADELAAMQASINNRLQKHYIRRKGVEDPASIPFASKMRVFFDAAQRHGPAHAAIAEWLRGRLALGESDAAILADVVLATDRPQGVETIAEKTRTLQSELAELTEPAAAIEIGRQQNALQDESDALWTAHFDRKLAPLSRDARRTLDEYIHREVVPRMTNIRVDYAALYADAVTLLPQIKQLQAAGLLQTPAPAQMEDAADHSEGNTTSDTKQ